MKCGMNIMWQKPLHLHNFEFLDNNNTFMAVQTSNMGATIAQDCKICIKCLTFVAQHVLCQVS
jgi:hypothetical protein